MFWVCQMSTKPRSLLANFTSLFVGTVGAKVLALLSVVLLSRYLGVADFGRYSLVFSFFALLNTVVDLGAGSLLAREVSSNLKQPRKGFETAIYLRILGCVVFLPPAFLLAPLLGIDHHLTLAVMLGVFCAFEAFYDAWFTAAMRLDSVAKARFFAGVVNLVLIALAIFMHLGLWWVVLVGMLNPLVKLGFDHYYCDNDFAIKLHTPDFTAIKNTLRDTLPLWWMGLLYIILARVDTFMLVGLSPQTGDYDLGIYAAAFRFSEMLALVTTAITPAVLPVLVHAKNNPQQMQWMTAVGTRVVMAGLLAVCMLMFWYAPLVIGIFYGQEYAPATQCLQVLVWSQAMVAVNSLAYQILMVYNEHGRRSVMLACVGMVAVNILANWYLIPRYQAMGASIATVLTEIAMLVVMVYFVEKLTPGRLLKEVTLLPVLCGLACLPLLWLHWGWGAVSVVLFAVLLFATGLLTPALIKKLAQSKIEN